MRPSSGGKGVGEGLRACWEGGNHTLWGARGEECFGGGNVLGGGGGGGGSVAGKSDGGFAGSGEFERKKKLGA